MFWYNDHYCYWGTVLQTNPSERIAEPLSFVFCIFKINIKKLLQGTLF